MTLKPRRCAGIKTTMINGNNTIAQKSSSNVSRYTNIRLHSSVRRNDRETSEYNNQNWLRWNNVIVLRYKQSWYISLIWLLNKVISNLISRTNNWLQSSMRRNHRNLQKYNNQQWWWWNDTIVMGEKQWWYMATIWSLRKLVKM